MSFGNYRDHANPLFRSLNILKFVDNLKIQNMLLVYYSLNNRLPLSLNNIYQYTQNIHNHNTRSSAKLKLTLPKVDTTTYGLNSIKYQSITDWNKLIDEYPAIKFHELKRSSFKRILMHYFYSKYN